MTYDLTKALLKLVPGAEWVLRGNEYSGLEWHNGHEFDKPTEEELVKKAVELEYQEEINEYQRQRAREYPSYADQFDQIYHEGVDAWKASIQVVKDKYPKQTISDTELQKRKDKALLDLQVKQYLEATERLSQYILLEGRPERVQTVVVGQKITTTDEGEIIETDITETSVIQTKIEPLEEYLEITTTDQETLESTTETVRNPLVVKDEEERLAAQLIVDNASADLLRAVESL